MPIPIVGFTVINLQFTGQVRACRLCSFGWKIIWGGDTWYGDKFHFWEKGHYFVRQPPPASKGRRILTN